MKKFFAFLFILLLLAAGITGWLFFTSATQFDEKSKYVLVYEKATAQQEVTQQLEEKQLVRNVSLFNALAARLDVWQKIKPGRFEITKGQSLFSILRMLRNNRQVPARLVINKLRTREDLARVIGKNFRVDSATAIRFLNSNDSLQAFGVDTNTVMTLVIPDTYVLNWSTPLDKILARLLAEQAQFWTSERRQKATNQNLTTEQVYTLASIVEEETNANQEKGKIASVYMNRIAKGMNLGADPTVKFALKDFAIRRISNEHTQVVSPYNTYRNKGLPPGPICTPSKITIDAVLDAPRTEYLFFVASAEMNGTHHFSATYAEHLDYAKAYHKGLDQRGIKR
ncbi:UPF0755 protein [Filimonas zeae]|uniref:Endolytic murein transglycosylase n=1 Tax=Filimonas zeae TaxID=1737353 RepID=A0A917MUF1_9BACT|nr:endolytic transglycosylase MltG [Filimonas zeae]MDR6339164.1 UPF0755 protein [Filimonas zeae]GGH64822.1 aminodeoxychorismate lyase [Filimonas zeae]